MDTDAQLKKMEADWDARARENARFFVASSRQEWSDQDFFESGRLAIRNFIANDMTNICRGNDPKAMRVLEVGCGAGRVTRALGELFGEVYGLDVSQEMVDRAKDATSDQPHVHVVKNNGMDLAALPSAPLTFDFAFSQLVFQHIPSKQIIESYVSAIGERLRPGALFKFQLQGVDVLAEPDDTWLGVGFTPEETTELAERNGFEKCAEHGAGTQDYWLWFFRRDGERKGPV